MSDLLAKTREICHIFDIKPARSKGQNFLINETVYDHIIEAADLNKEDIVLEVGPGLGFLTAKLAQRVKKVIAVELDDKLVQVLQTGIDSQEVDNIEIVNQDVLRFNLERMRGVSYKIVANLPYNITSIFLRQILSSDYRPTSIVLMLQKEVVARIVAQPPKMSLLAVSVQLYAHPEIIEEVLAPNFWPQPKVDSAVIKINIKDNVFSKEEEKIFWRLLKTGFSAKRKMLKNNLASGLKIKQEIIETVLEKTGLEPKIRAERLSITDWQKLFANLKEFMV